MPAASSRAQKIVRSGSWNSPSTRRTPARASPGRPAHSASSVAAALRLAGKLDVADVPREEGVNPPPPPGSGSDIAAQQVDLGANLVRQPVDPVRRVGG